MLIDPVTPDDLRRAVLATLRERWSPPFPQPERFESAEYQACSVLTMCRALYTLQHGAVVSKSRAARWAQEARGERWAGLVEWALAWLGEGPLARRDETLDFALFTRERGRVS